MNSYWNQYNHLELMSMHGVEPPDDDEEDEDWRVVRRSGCNCGRCSYCLCC